MTSLQELFQKHGISTAEGRAYDAKSRLITQADAMLRKLAAMTDDSELESTTSSQNWWSNKRMGTQRRVSMRYGGLVVQGSASMTDDTVSAVKQRIQQYRTIIEESVEDTWKEEEQRRKK